MLLSLPSFYGTVGSKSATSASDIAADFYSINKELVLVFDGQQQRSRRHTNVSANFYSQYFSFTFL
jgi:hypothetical protein